MSPCANMVVGTETPLPTHIPPLLAVVAFPPTHPLPRPTHPHLVLTGCALLSKQPYKKTHEQPMCGHAQVDDGQRYLTHPPFRLPP
jgi:hypothetical protein